MSKKEKKLPYEKPDNRPQRRADFFMNDRLAGSENIQALSTRGIRSPEHLESAEKGKLANLRVDQLRAYRIRLIEKERNKVRTREAIAPPPANNWIPLGPSAVLKGQVGGAQVVSGRAPAIAFAPGGQRMYLGTANGGVWRTMDGGESWTSLMDNFDLLTDSDTPIDQADSLACGALVLIPGGSPGEDTIYVGTGEGHSSLDKYNGVGVVVSTDGGRSWTTETSTPTVSGSGFYAMVVDPTNPQTIVAGTSNGLYVRTGGTWNQIALPGQPANANVSGVTVALNAAGNAVFFAAVQGNNVYRSTNGGQSWGAGPVAPGFPVNRVGRISIATHPTNANIVYALVALTGDPPAPPPALPLSGNLEGVHRLDLTDAVPTWRRINHNNGLDGLFQRDFLNKKGQGWYDIVITVAPNNVNTIFVGGGSGATSTAAALYRCVLTVTGTGAATNITTTPVDIGATVHADIHGLYFPADNPNQLWVCCDGGVFVSNNPYASTTTFLTRNHGLQTMTMNYFDQHPLEDAVIFCGAQDNGGLRYTGDEVWLHSAPGDGGYTVINRNDPFTILNGYTNNSVRWVTDGGQRDPNYANMNYPNNGIILTVGVPAGTQGERVRFYPPIVGAPAAINAPNLVAFGTDRLWVSTDFGNNWNPIPSRNPGNYAAWNTENLGSRISAIAIGSAQKIYIGTESGQVHVYNSNDNNWTTFPAAPNPRRLDNVGANSLNAIMMAPSSNPITSIAVDPTNDNRIFVTIGGTYGTANAHNFKRVWLYDDGASAWTHQGGVTDPLLNVQHNRVIIDPTDNTTMYAASDIGIWRSQIDNPGGGPQLNWKPISEGLPDSAVFDLQILPARTINGTTRPPLLRAATHGRGIYERTLDNVPKQGIELYIRDTILDMGRFDTTLGKLPEDNTKDILDPRDKNVKIENIDSPDIKVDVPDANGFYQFPFQNASDTIHFVEFIDQLQNKSQEVITHATSVVTSRVYVQVHNRGVLPANNVQVLAMIASASGGSVPNLPAGYESNIQNGQPINSGGWTTIGLTSVSDVRVGFPRIVPIDLTSDKLPAPGALAGNDEFYLMVFLHHADDNYTSNQTNGQTNTVAERKSTYTKIKVVEFGGTLPVMNKKAPLAGYVPIPATATLANAPYDAFLAGAFRINDNFIERSLSSAVLSPFTTNDTQLEVVLNGTPNTDPELLISAKTITLETDIDLKSQVPLVWFASEKITINAKINALGKGAANGNQGDFGGAGGQGASANGENCTLPESGMVIAAGGQGGTPNGANITEDWASRALLHLANCKGGAAGGDGTVGSGAAGGGTIILCAPTIELHATNGQIDAQGAAASAGNGGGGGGGVVVLIAGEMIEVRDPLTSGNPNVLIAGGAKHGTGGDGGAGIVIKKVYS